MSQGTYPRMGRLSQKYANPWGLQYPKQLTNPGKLLQALLNLSLRPRVRRLRLPQQLQYLLQPALFWLPVHCATDRTERNSNKNPDALNDVAGGYNEGCLPHDRGFYATEGFDTVTGYGTPNFPKLVEAREFVASDVFIRVEAFHDSFCQDFQFQFYFFYLPPLTQLKV